MLTGGFLTSLLANREAQKEVELLEKKMQRLEAARAAEIAQLTAELQSARDSVVEQLSAKDSKVNDLIEELGNTQALLSEKEAALAEVGALFFQQRATVKVTM